MANNFDPNSLNKFFDQQFGQGSFDSGIQQARNTAKLKVQANFAKQDITSKLKKAREKALQKTYDDAVSYWNDPTNKEHLLNRGVHNIENDYLNDPRMRAAIKDQGFDQQDFIDAMYNVASGGDQLSKRGFNQSQKKQNYNLSEDQQKLIPLGSTDKSNSTKTKSKQSSSQTKSKNNGVLGGLFSGLKGIGSEIGAAATAAEQFVNPFDKVSADQAVKNYMNRNQSTGFQEVARGANRAVDSASLGLMSNLDKKVNNRDPYYNSQRDFGQGGGTDMITSGLGYLVPGLGAAKAVKAVGLGAKAIPTLEEGAGLAAKLARGSQVAKEGALVGGSLPLAQMGINYALNPKDQNLKDNLTNVALGVGLGAIGDPLLRGVGAGVGKGIQTAANKTMKGLLPSNERVANVLAGGLKQEPLGLPAPQMRLNAPQLQLSGPKPLQASLDALLNTGKKPNGLQNPIPQVPDKLKNIMLQNDLKNSWADFAQGSKSLPKARPQYITNLDLPADPLNRGPQYWQQRYEDFAKFINDNGYTPNNLSHDSINELWTHFAKNDEPVTIDQVVELAYPKGFEAPPKPTVESPPQQTEPNLKDLLNSDPRIKQAVQKLFPNGSAEPKISRQATLEEMVQNLESQVPPKQVTAPLEPLQFRLLTDMERQIKPKQKLGGPLPPLENGAKSSGTKSHILNPKNGPLPPLNPNLLRTGTNAETNSLQGLPLKPLEMANNGLKERGHIETLKQSPNAVDELKSRLNGTYEPTTNKEAVNLANNRINQDIEKAVSFVKNARVLKPEHVATAHRLIQEFQKTGQIEKAVDIAEHIAAQGTKAGQAVQAFSIFDRLSPEGILIHANRVADRVNAKLAPNETKVKVTNDMANQLTDLATTVQKMTNQKTVANDVISLMDKAKTGQKLNDAETKQLRQFVDDAKQFIDDIKPKKTAPKAPNKIVSPKIKEQVVNFLDQQEAAARKRLAQRKGRALSGLPVDDFYDYTVIGAAKLAKGTIKFADFSEQMVKEFGEEIRPHIQQIYDKASEMVNNQVKRTVNHMSDVEKITNKALKNGKIESADADNLRKFAASIANMSGDAKIEASQELQATLQALERPTLLEKISAGQTIAQLLNTKTQVRNAIGNELFYRLERINKLVATPIDWARSKVTGGERTITFKTNNQGQYWKNWIKGAKAGWKGVNPEGLMTQYDLRPNVFSAKWNPLTYMQKALGASLKSFDYAGYKRAVNNTLGELATLRATNEGLTGQAKKIAIEKYIREADENILTIADAYGKYATFQDNNVLAVGLQKFKTGLNFGKEFGLGDLIIKYPRTPGSLLARALEYSPAGILKAVYQIAKPLYRGEKIPTREVTESLTRALIGGGGITGIAWFLADKGILTGTGNKDFDTADLETQAGKAKYSLNIDALRRWVLSGFNPNEGNLQQGDRFISYNWAQPVATEMSVGSNWNNNQKTTGNVNIPQLALGGLNSILDTMVEQSVLQGVKQAFTSSPGQSVGDKVMDIAGGLPASFVPTAFNQLRQITDNTSRNTFDPSKLQTYMNRAINKVPGGASKLPPAYDTLGNQKEAFKDQSNTLFNVFLNPAFVNQYKPSPEAKMVLDVINTTGDTSAAPRMAQKYLIIDGKRYNLTSQQYSDYQKRLGSEVRNQLQSLVPYANSDDKEKLGKEIVKILDKAGRTVREQLKKEYR
jgi:hypothetical protein